MERAEAVPRAPRPAERIPLASQRRWKRHGKPCENVWTGDVTAANARDTRSAGPRGPLVAGVELSATVARVIVATRENSRLRVTGRGEAGLAEGAVTGGLVVDRESVSAALATAFGAAERGQRVERSIVAIDGDDVRTYHLSTSFERESSAAPVAANEISRATRQAATAPAQTACASAEEDPPPPGAPTAPLHEDVAALPPHAPPRASLVGPRGGVLGRGGGAG